MLLLIVTNVFNLPDVRTEGHKRGPEVATYSEWGPVFRIDVLFVPGNTALLLHDGALGSAMHEYNDDPSSLTSYDSDPRALPFKVLGTPPGKELIVGSAAGNEILASLHFKAKKIEGAELNPVTLSLLTDRYKKYSGDLGHQPGVSLHNADAAPTWHAARSTTTSFGTSHPTATPRTTRPRRARSSCPRATCTRSKQSKTG